MDFPNINEPNPPILTTLHLEVVGAVAPWVSSNFNNCTSVAWPVANKAYFHPFVLSQPAIAYQLLFFVGATSSGNLDVGIYDGEKNLIVSAGSTAMSATVNTVQEFNIADTVLPAGTYYLAAAVDNTTATGFATSSIQDEIVMPAYPIYEQAGLTAAALVNPGVPVLCTDSSPRTFIFGIQLRSVF